jgi:hypothetical protein
MACYNTFAMNYNSSSAVIVAHQLSLCPPLPRVVGPVEFTEFCARWTRLDALLRGGVERDFVTRSLRRHHRRRPMTLGEQEAFQQESRRALRCTVARALLVESLRDFSRHLAESTVLQRFCLLGDLEAVTIPGHSQVQRYQYWLPAEEMRAVITGLVAQAQAAEAPTTLGLAQPVALGTVWVDSTCAATHIHYPVDWLLLRDAVRTLLQAIGVVRAHGLKHRMPEPETVQKTMNQLCIKMTHVGKGEKAKQRRKAVLREMTALTHTVQAHAARYVALVEGLPTPSGWAVAAARRMRAVLEQLPAVLHQAHERIIGERAVANAEKVLSLHEPDTAVITRGKAGAQVEFGHSLLLVEQRDGLIVDWALPRAPQPDGTLLTEAIPRWETAYGRRTIRAAVTDRGFDGRGTREALMAAEIENGLCPRSPRQLAARLTEDPAFGEQQRRRAQTEGRVAIVKQTFLGGRLHTKGHAHHEQEVAGVILAHNLWVLARLPAASRQRHAA